MEIWIEFYKGYDPTECRITEISQKQCLVNPMRSRSRHCPNLFALFLNKMALTTIGFWSQIAPTSFVLVSYQTVVRITPDTFKIKHDKAMASFAQSHPKKINKSVWIQRISCWYLPTNPPGIAAGVADFLEKLSDLKLTELPLESAEPKEPFQGWRNGMPSGND